MPTLRSILKSTMATVIKPTIKGMLNPNKPWSPIVLCRLWPTLPRLVLLVFCSVFGVTMNGFFLSAFFVNNDLRRVGNVFLACAGLADFIINAAVIPMSVVVLLSGIWENTAACHTMQTLVAASTYAYSIFFSLVGIVSWLRVSHTRKIWVKYLPYIVTIIALSVFIISFALAIVGTDYGLDYDYCERSHAGNYYFRLATTSIHGFTFIVTLSTFTASYFKLSNDNRIHARYRRSVQYHNTMSMIKLNIFMYLLYVMLWLPYLVVVNFFPDATDAVFYLTACLGIVRSLLSSVLYASLNPMFGRSYSSIFYYCFYRTSLQTYPNRQRRAEYGHFARNIADVRTHIMQQAVNTSNSQRGASSIKDWLEL